MMEKLLDIESFVTMCEVGGIDVINMEDEESEDYHKHWMMLLDHRLLWHNQINFHQGYFRLLTKLSQTSKIKQVLEQKGVNIKEGCLHNIANRSLECTGDVFPVLLDLKEILDEVERA